MRDCCLCERKKMLRSHQQKTQVKTKVASQVLTFLNSQSAGARMETFEKFTWTIHNFSKIDSKKLYSETFCLGGHSWRILIYPKGSKNNANYLSIYLDAGNLANLPEKWNRFANFKLVLINQVNGEESITQETDHKFDKEEPDWGFTEFISLSELFSGFIVNDTCIIEAEISTISVGELVYFRGFGKIEEAFVPLLEEVCSWHPSLLECQRKRNGRFTEWAFTALGSVLHFLKTKKGKDMNEDAFCHLQFLWDELQSSKFDLNWLEPHIQSALGMKSYTERAEKVKRIKKNVDELKEKMVTAVLDLEMAKLRVRESRTRL